MSQNFIFNTSFFEVLMQIDNELAADALKKGCPYCGGQ